MHEAIQRHDEFHEGKAAWERMSMRERRELVANLPEHVAADKVKLYAAAWLIELGDTGNLTPAAFQRRWQALLGAAVTSKSA